MVQIPIKLLTKTARMPSRGTKFAAGLDLYADGYQFYTKYYSDSHPDPGNPPIELSVSYAEIDLSYHNPGDLIIVSTGISMAIPKGMVGIIHGRSGWAFKYGLTCANYGLIDSDYRGELKCLLIIPDRLISDPIVLKQGDRVAQLLIQKYEAIEPFSAKALEESERGEGGFGSTGI